MLQRSKFEDNFIDSEISQLTEEYKKMDGSKRVVRFLWRWREYFALDEDLLHLEYILLKVMRKVNPKKNFKFQLPPQQPEFGKCNLIIYL
jgi:hypothetical protein